MRFVDQIEICVAAGKGGDGSISFKRARNMPKLGPDGGNGGRGGDVIVIGTTRLNTLSHLRYKQSYRAQDGGKGGSNNCTGACGDHKIIEVPVGTVIYDYDSKEKLGEVLNDGDNVLVAKGGKHGLGNLYYTTSIHQAPMMSRQGAPGEQKTLSFELKVIAHVGLAGMPNAGKSTFLSSISNATPKIADYPFTTLTPQLGVVSVDGSFEDAFVVADIPGLIEGAALGKGLGHQFLRHLERTKVILVLADATSDAPQKDFEKLLHELEAFSPELVKKEMLFVYTKKDLLGGMPDKDALPVDGQKTFLISSHTGEGVKALLYQVRALVTAQDAQKEDHGE